MIDDKHFKVANSFAGMRYNAQWRQFILWMDTVNVTVSGIIHKYPIMNGRWTNEEVRKWRKGSLILCCKYITAAAKFGFIFSCYFLTPIFRSPLWPENSKIWGASILSTTGYHQSAAAAAVGCPFSRPFPSAPLHPNPIYCCLQ